MRLRSFAISLVVITLLCLASSVFASSLPQPALPFTGTVTYVSNLRTGPGTTYAIAGQARPGDTLTVVECNAACDWYKLDTGQWVAAFLVKPVMVTPTATSTTLLTPTVAVTATLSITSTGAISTAAPLTQTITVTPSAVSTQTGQATVVIIPYPPANLISKTVSSYQETMGRTEKGTTLSYEALQDAQGNKTIVAYANLDPTLSVRGRFIGRAHPSNDSYTG